MHLQNGGFSSQSRKKPTKNPEMDPMLGQGQAGFLSHNLDLAKLNYPTTQWGSPRKPIKNRGPSISECLCGRRVFPGIFQNLHTVAESDVFFDGSRSSSEVCKLGRFAGLLVSVLFFVGDARCCEVSRKQHLRKAEWKFLYELRLK